MAKDYYDILGVDKSASQDDIKKAFRKKAHEHHPDKGNGNADKFKELNEAYQTIGNENKRKQYDQFGSAGGPGGFNYSDFSGARGGSPFGQGGVNFDFGDLGDLFGGMFNGGGGGRTEQARGASIETELPISFEESVFGVEKMLNLSKRIVCSTCQGNGAEPGSKVNTCKKCSGSGKVSSVQQTILGTFQSQSVCPDCSGEGKSYDKKCSKCSGSGVEYGSEKIKIKVPAGIENGQQIRLTGKGEASPKGIAGDLYINIRVNPSSKFKRQLDDIRSDYHLSISQASLGDKVEVSTVDGPVTLKIPAGTQSHTEFKLSGKGVPHLRVRGRGDHIVRVLVDIPKGLNRKQRKLLEELDI
jgi:molecular chaperone DnaJ